jgi:hypothetical protein
LFIGTESHTSLWLIGMYDISSCITGLVPYGMVGINLEIIEGQIVKISEIFLKISLKLCNYKKECEKMFKMNTNVMGQSKD